LPIEVKYHLWMEKTSENGTRKFLSVVPVETIEPYMVDITEDPPAINLDFFQRDLYCHLDGREKLWYLCDRLHKRKQLYWVVLIANSRKYSKKAHMILRTDSDLLDFLKEAKRLRPNQASVLMTMDDPIASEKEQRSVSMIGCLKLLDLLLRLLGLGCRPRRSRTP
jgi:hypothetical protein